MWRLLAVACGLAALTACPGVVDDDEPGNGNNPCDTGCADPDEPTIEMAWDADGLTIVLSDVDTTGFDFGIAETIDTSAGWFGEDCLNGTAEWRLCHVMNNTLVGRLDSIFDEIEAGDADFDDVIPGETTLFDESFDAGGRLTYVVTIDGGDCFVWGQDPWYYLGDPSFDSCRNLN